MPDLEVVWSGAHSRQGLLLSGDWPPQRESHYDRLDDGERVRLTPAERRVRTYRRRAYCPICRRRFTPDRAAQTYCSRACALKRPKSLEFRASLHPSRRGHCCDCGCRGWITTSRRYLPGHQLLADRRRPA